jgi:hypothetical protein
MLVSKTGFAYNQHGFLGSRRKAGVETMDVTPASHVAVILLACESFVLLLIPAAIIGGSAYGVHWLRRKLPPLFAQARKYVTLLKVYVERASMAAVSPFIAARALAARVRAYGNALARFFQGEN